MKSKVTAEGWKEVEHSTLREREYPRLEIDVGDPRYVVGFEFTTRTGTLDPFNWGVRRKVDGHPAADPDLKRALDTAFGEGRAWSRWLWIRTAKADLGEALAVAGNWEASPQPWVMIAKGEMGPRLIEAARKVRAVLAANRSAAPGAGSGGG